MLIAERPSNDGQSFTPRHLFHLSGLALLLAWPLQAIGFILHPASEEVHHVLYATYGPAHVILFVSWVLALLGLPGLYAWQAQRAGHLGLAGYVLLILATAYHLYLLLYEAFATTTLASDPATRSLVGEGPMAHGVERLGMIAMPLVLAFPIFGWAILRAGVLPRASAWLQIAGLPAMIASMIILEFVAPGAVEVIPIRILYIVTFLGWAWGGFAIWTATRRESVATGSLTPSRPMA